MTTEREPDTEAGSYIEDDPAAWLAFVEAVREYAAQYDALTKHLGTPDAAAEVVAGSMLSWLADQRGVFVRSGHWGEQEVEALGDEADDMCPNCVTPWKCNGPHLEDQTPAAARKATKQ